MTHPSDYIDDSHFGAWGHLLMFLPWIAVGMVLVTICGPTLGAILCIPLACIAFSTNFIGLAMFGLLFIMGGIDIGLIITVPSLLVLAVPLEICILHVITVAFPGT